MYKLINFLLKAILTNHRNTVKLKFEAFAVWNGINHPISPAVYSQTIRNKSIQFCYTITMIKYIIIYNFENLLRKSK